MVEITRHIHSIDGIEEPFGIGNVPYLVEERPNDLIIRNKIEKIECITERFNPE
ncbi:MAG: hypothetical protein WAK17_24260 [Candidatus Nitrosopolaris sp.]|jgi:hypothetical protein